MEIIEIIIGLICFCIFLVGIIYTLLGMSEDKLYCPVCEELVGFLGFHQMSSEHKYNLKRNKNQKVVKR